MVCDRRARAEKKRRSGSVKATDTFYDLPSVYLAVVSGLKIIPSEFWKMTPTEVNILLSAEASKHRQLSGGLSDAQLDRLDERRAELEAKGIKVL